MVHTTVRFLLARLTSVSITVTAVSLSRPEVGSSLEKGGQQSEDESRGEGASDSVFSWRVAHTCPWHAHCGQ